VAGYIHIRYYWAMIAKPTSAFRIALAETVSWCSIQPMSSEAVETPESIRRRALTVEACNILRGVSHRRAAYESAEWRRAMDMLKEADPDTLAPLEHQLRTSALKPLSALGEFISESQRESIVAEVVSIRSRLLSIEQSPRQIRYCSEDLGRILIYTPSENVADGASKYASMGFYDANDAPPWDSWVHYLKGELICWVPSVLVPLAQDGIDANPVECIRWADSELVTKLG
jgi:hypothetical protein